MHIHFEKTINAQCDCTILSMSWMGKVPDELPEDEGWKLNRTHYYQEGWLATGNVRGVLGVTYTTSHWKRNSSDVPLRTNYNLRGHRSQITLVQWNEPYQKLASCDSSGIIFVWIKFEGRWSIELINDRNTPVTHFSWSHDGRMALICYQDNFVLVGSVAGQRYWSTLLNLDATITCGIWTPDDQQVYFGTSNGQVVVMDVHGVMLSQVQLPSDSPISSMAWSCEKFKMEESEDGEATSSSNHYCSKRPFLLAVCFKTGGIYLMKSYDDVAPTYVSTGMHGLHMEWSNSGEFLAVAGSRPIEVLHENGNRVKEYSNSLHVYNHQGTRIVNINIPHVLSPVTSMTWGHNDKRIFIATGKLVHVGWVSKRIASLQLLCRLAIYRSLSTETCVSHLPLPLPVRALISSLHTQTIPSLLQNVKDLRDFVTHPPSGSLRLYCTMIRHDDDSNQSPGTAYTLYLEYLGGLIPILKGKRTSKIRPEFVIYDPQATEENGFSMLMQQGSERNCGGGMVACGINVGVGAAYCCHCNHHHAVHFHQHQNSCHGSGDNGNSFCNKSTCSGANNLATPTPCTSSVCSTGTGSVLVASPNADGSLTNNGVPAHYHCHCCCHHHQHHHHHHQQNQHHHHHHHPPGNVGSSTTPAISQSCNASTIGSSIASLGFSDSSESEDVELCASPRMQRKRYRNRQRERERLLEREREREWERTRSSVHLMPEPAHPHQLIYNDVLPEAVRLVEVTSNIWGTKFKIHGVSPQLPDSLGQVTYKTSLLHLQPRQMTLLITELRDDIFFSPESLLVNGGYLDEDEEDLSIVVGPEPSLSLSSVPGQGHRYTSQGGQQNGAVVVQNGEGNGGGGGGGNSGSVRGDVYTGANVIYHPQGVPRGEDSPPIISTSRCYLQSSTPSSSSSLLNYQQSGVDGINVANNCTVKNHPGPSSDGGSGSSGPSTSSYGSNILNYNSSSSSFTTAKSELYDTDDQDEFPYVDLTANTEIIQFRETLKNSLNYETVTSSTSSSTTRDSNLISNCRSTMCQVCESTPSAVPHTPVKVLTSATIVGGGGNVGGGGGGNESNVDLSDKALQRIKYGQMRAQVERIVADSHQSSGASMVGGVATSTPTLPSRSSRSLRSPKKVSGSGSSSSSRLSTLPQILSQSQVGTVTEVVNCVSHQHSVSAGGCSSSLNHSNDLYEQQLQQMQPVPVTAPIVVRRSMSASYLDSVDRNVVISLDVVGNEVSLNSPPKRLILVKKRGQNGESGTNEDSTTNAGGKPRLKDWGKSKSWDSCDLSGWKSGCRSAGPGGNSTFSTTGSSYRREVSTSACPKCRFPSTEPVKTCVTMAEPLVHGRANVPMTPQRRNVMSNCSTSKNSPFTLQQRSGVSGSNCTSINRSRMNTNKDQDRASSSAEDAIENADNSSTSSSPSNSTPTHRPRESPSPGPPPCRTPPPQQSSSIASTVHRRSLSLLTPLLKRREMLNASRQQQSADGTLRKQGTNNSQTSNSTSNAPHSSSFIPPGSPQHQPRSSPSTPATQRRSRHSYLSSASSPFRQLFINSPLLSRRKNKGNNGNGSSRVSGPEPNGGRRRSMIDSSDDEGAAFDEYQAAQAGMAQAHPVPSSSGSSSNCSTLCSSSGGINNDSIPTTCPHASSSGSSSSVQIPSFSNASMSGRDCEILQRTQIHHQKVGRKKIQCMETCPMAPRRREFLMHNKAPMWNENSQVYQLDFGGRVTQESAKNFQIEFRGKQVMQFGRIDGSAYTLDFQYPFAAVQAFSVALANVTQRLK